MPSDTYSELQETLRAKPLRWLITGAAGFIGSNLVEALLGLGQSVAALDNFATGSRKNIEDLSRAARPNQFEFIEGDILDSDACRRACTKVDVVLHQAALGSVPRSIKDPLASHAANVTGFLNVAMAARDAGVSRMVYASSSSVYGDHPDLPKREERIGRPLSPYSASKYADEIYAQALGNAYGLPLVGLRYFNVFGPRQTPDGPYAAVVPRWFAGLLCNREVVIYGDGETSRDFCFIANVVQVNLLAAAPQNAAAAGEVFNIAFGERTTLNELYELIREQVVRFNPQARNARPVYRDFRPGDVRHSLADISKARERLGYRPSHSVREGLALAATWYRDHLR